MFKSILVPIDLAHRSSWQFALPQAIELATVAGGALRVITVIRGLELMASAVHDPFQLEQLLSEARQKLSKIVSEHAAEDLKIDQEVRYGSIGHEILAVAKERHVDLILMASHRPEMRDYLIGPNAAHVAQHSPCSVLVLRRFGEAQA